MGKLAAYPMLAKKTGVGLFRKSLNATRHPHAAAWSVSSAKVDTVSALYLSFNPIGIARLHIPKSDSKPCLPARDMASTTAFRSSSKTRASMFRPIRVFAA